MTKHQHDYNSITLADSVREVMAAIYILFLFGILIFQVDGASLPEEVVHRPTRIVNGRDAGEGSLKNVAQREDYFLIH